MSLSVEHINNLRQNARSVIRELGLLNEAYFEIGVTLAERHLLIELASSPPLTMGEVAEKLLLDKSTISRLISKAVKKGYITCIPDKKDKRKRYLQMTETGQKTLQAFEPIAFQQTKQALLTLSSEEIEMVYKGVALYAKGLKNSRTGITHKDTKIESLQEIFETLHQMGYALRLFEPQDEEGLYAIFQEVVDSGTQFPYESSSKSEFHRQFFSSHGQTYVCHSLKNELIGGFYLKSNGSDRSHPIVNAAYMIHANSRGKGIGSLLIKASLHFAKDLGFQTMQFNRVLSQNKLAIKLYKRLGFNIVGTFQDAYVMHRHLEKL